MSLPRKVRATTQREEQVALADREPTRAEGQAGAHCYRPNSVGESRMRPLTGFAAHRQSSQFAAIRPLLYVASPDIASVRRANAWLIAQPATFET